MPAPAYLSISIFWAISMVSLDQSIFLSPPMTFKTFEVIIILGKFRLPDNQRDVTPKAAEMRRHSTMLSDPESALPGSIDVQRGLESG